MKDKVISFLKKYYIAIIIIALALVLDQVTKLLASLYLDYAINEEGYVTYSNPTVVIDGFFSFTYARNRGAGWSIMSGKMWFFYIITVVSLVIFAYLLKDFNLKKYPFASIGLSLMVGGTLGNFIDRIFNGYVVDFFDFIIFGYDYPIFNVADICLVVGAIMLIFQVIISKDYFGDITKKKENFSSENISSENISSEESSLEVVE